MAKSLAKALSFWAYLTLFAHPRRHYFFSFLRPSGPHSNILNLPADLRRHYLARETRSRSNPQTQLFSPTQLLIIEDGPRTPHLTQRPCSLPPRPRPAAPTHSRNVMPSLSAAGIRSIAIDLPGSGFSERIGASGNVNWLFRIWREIRAKGIFWAFDQLVETGEIPEPQIGGGSVSELFGRVVGQVFDEMSLRKPVHLVLHDSAWGAAMNWVSANSGSVRSVTFLDSSPAELPAFPFRFLEMPVVGDLVMHSRIVFGWLVKVCCLRSENGKDAAEVYRSLMRYNAGREGVIAVGNGLNYSFDLGEWAMSERMKDVKFQVLWSNMWSDRWIDEGRRMAAVLLEARLSWHFGGRWPQSP
ncbi:protein AUXIN RESPONSE 4 isoform X2 [Asparagus officinalis]|uniref:protein AUXIN RESPONSE 4 isoform X2 n=1 Tax=Asparagus officinalis TaxID=4686 RepID=UPI00098E3147|nr:protein AUXIN RESPONSE 4 isoform X2 [Asparagus officinalis]